MAEYLNVFKTSKRDCILSKSNFSFAKVHWVIYRSESDQKIKILTIWALKPFQGIYSEYHGSLPINNQHIPIYIG